MDAAREVADLDERGLRLLVGAERTSAAAPPAVGPARASPGPAEIDGERHEPRLSAVVEVALDLPRLPADGRDGMVALLGDRGALELAARRPEQRPQQRDVEPDQRPHDPRRHEQEREARRDRHDVVPGVVADVLSAPEVRPVRLRLERHPDRRGDPRERGSPERDRDRELDDPEREQEQQVESRAPAISADEAASQEAPHRRLVAPGRLRRRLDLDAERDPRPGALDPGTCAGEPEREHEQRQPDERDRQRGARRQQGDEDGEPEGAEAERRDCPGLLAPGPRSEGLGQEGHAPTVRPRLRAPQCGHPAPASRANPTRARRRP